MDAPTQEELIEMAESMLFYDCISTLPSFGWIGTNCQRSGPCCRILGIESPDEFYKVQAQWAVERGKVPY
jgi:hypothetical protein